MRLEHKNIYITVIMLILFLTVGCGTSKPSDKDLEDAEKKIEQAYKKSQPPSLDETKTQDGKTQTIEQPKKTQTATQDVKKTTTTQDPGKTEVKKTPDVVQKNTEPIKKTEPTQTSQTTTKPVDTTTTKTVTTTAQKPVETKKDPVSQPKKTETPKTVVSKDAGKDSKERNVEDVVKEKEIYKYSSHNKRDPFINPYGSNEEKDGTTSQQKLVDAEDVDFSKLNYRGIIQYGNELVAMLEDDAGRGVVLKVGSVIGGAKVESITREMVVLRRFVIKTEGQPREIILHKVTE